MLFSNQEPSEFKFKSSINMPRETKLQEFVKATAKDIANGVQKLLTFGTPSATIGQKRKFEEVQNVEQVQVEERKEPRTDEEKLKEIERSFREDENTPRLKEKRNTYSIKQKNLAVKLYEIIRKKDFSQGHAESYIQRVKGFEKVTRKMLEDWSTPKVSMHRGRPVCEEFDEEVLNEVIVTQISNNCQTLEVLANAAFSYECFRHAGQQVQKRAKYRENEPIQNLQFSVGWTQKFLERHKLKRRRCTTVEKPKPSREVIERDLNEIQNEIETKGITPDRIFNEDETGIRWCPALMHQYVPTDASRAINPSGDSTGRFTSLIGASARGDFLPSFIVLQSSCQDKRNLRSSTLLNKLLEEGNICAHGWVKLFHECIIKDSRGVDHLWQRPFLYNPETLDIITVQNSAWNDASTMILHIEMQLKPYKEKHFTNKDCLLIVDNVSFHKTNEVQLAFQAAGWIVKYLPPNMTDELQPMDLVVNAVVKEELRKYRISQALDYIPKFKAKLHSYNSGWLKNVPMPTFDPPTPNYVDGVIQMHRLYETRFKDPKFQASLKKSFEDVGLTLSYSKTDNFPYFVKYQAYKHKRKGTVVVKTLRGHHHITSDEFNSLAGILSDIETRAESEDADIDSNILLILGENGLEELELDNLNIFDNIFEELE